MKPNTVKKTNVQTIKAVEANNSLKMRNADHSFGFEDFTLPQPMNKKEIQPPAYIWDKIASVLDEQDRMKTWSDSSAFAKPQKAKPKRFFLLAAFVMMVGAVVLSVL
jgi:hypothetical protein